VGVILISPTVKSLKTVQELLYRCDQISGVPFSDLERFSAKPWIGTSTQNKGWGGKLVERLVGGDAGGRPAADITNLGVEIKSIPIGADARVLMPTKIAHINYQSLIDQEWWESSAFHKLRAILFVPIVKFDTKTYREWFIRGPFLWLPSEACLKQFKSDYDAVRNLVVEGRFDEIHSAEPPVGQGVFLHPKPDARNASVDNRPIVIAGGVYRPKPKAWMLRASFTRQIVLENLRVSLDMRVRVQEDEGGPEMGE